VHPVLVTIAAALLIPIAAHAQDKSYQGLWLSTPYPSVQVAPGDDIGFDVTVHNKGLPPQRLALDLQGAPKGWIARLLGDGRPIGAVLVGPDQTASVRLELEPPEDAPRGRYQMTLHARSGTRRVELPLEIVIGDTPSARLELKPELPILPGTPDSTFSFSVDVVNKVGQDALIALSAEAPPGFQVSFKKRFGSQRLTSVAVEAGRTETVEVEVRPPQGTAAGSYTVSVRAAAGEAAATTDLTLEVSGQPELRLSAPGGLLSGSVEAGKQTSLQLVLHNVGSAPAQNLRFSASPPRGWEVAFEPETLATLPPGKEAEVRALVTAPTEAIAGDYMLTLRAEGEQVSENTEFRITVRTSTLWGVVGLLVIAAAVAVLALAVMRFGRR